MKCLGRVRLMVASACLCAFWVHPLGAQTQPPQPSPAPQQKPEQTPPSTPPQPQKNPFENVPAGPGGTPPPPQQQPAQQQRPVQPQLEAPKPAETVKPVAGEAIEAIEFRGARRVPQDTLKALIVSK